MRDRVAGVQDNLPEEADPPEVEKVDSNDDVIIWQNLSSDRMSVPELTDYAERYLTDQYSALDGVARCVSAAARATPCGCGSTAKRWPRAQSVGDVESALRAENVELPAGSLQSDERIFKARVERNFKQPEDFAKLVLARGEEGYLVRLGDVARVERGVVEDRFMFRGNGEPMVGLGVIKQSTANTIDVSSAVKALSERLSGNLPEGMRISQSYDAAVFIEASIAEVYKTLFIAIGCVVFVIYMFLGSVRAMLIPDFADRDLSVVPLGFDQPSPCWRSAIGGRRHRGARERGARIQEKGETRFRRRLSRHPPGFPVVATTLVLIAGVRADTFLEGDIGRLFTELRSPSPRRSVFVGGGAHAGAGHGLEAAQRYGRPRKTTWWSSASTLCSASCAAPTWRCCCAICPPILVTVVFFGLLGGTAWLYPTVTRNSPARGSRRFLRRRQRAEGSSYKYIEEYMVEIERRLQPHLKSGEFSCLLVRAPRGSETSKNFNDGFVVVIPTTGPIAGRPPRS